MSARDRPAPTEEAAGWASLASICRRESLFRKLGKQQAAQSVLDGELSPLLSKLGVSRDDERVARIAAEEEHRVEDASLLAQLLAPLLPSQGAVHAPPEEGKVIAFEPPAAPAPAGPLSIADMIDGMLAQERRARTR